MFTITMSSEKKSVIGFRPIIQIFNVTSLQTDQAKAKNEALYKARLCGHENVKVIKIIRM